MKCITLVYKVDDAETEGMIENAVAALKKHRLGAEGKVLLATCVGDAILELEILKTAIAHAGKVAHLYNTGSGLLGWLESEIKCIREDKEKGA